MALVCGFCLSVVYAFLTPAMLATLKVESRHCVQRRHPIYIGEEQLLGLLWHRAFACPHDGNSRFSDTAKNCCFGGSCQCMWATPCCVCGPYDWDCGGAAAATSFATLFSCGFMLRGLAKKNILPVIRIPSKKEVLGLLDFAGPLLAITVTRLGGFIAMQRTAMKLGVQSLAGYQLCINLLMFFLIFGEPSKSIESNQATHFIGRRGWSRCFCNS